MSVLLRNNAVGVPVNQTGLTGGGGSSGAVISTRTRKVREKAYYSRDPAAELMPAAEFLGQEPDFAAIIEDFEGSPFDPARRRVLGKLMGVFAMDYQGARAEERRFLRRLLNAGNAREGYAANRALHLAGAANVIRRTLALGVAESRFATEAQVPPRKGDSSAAGSASALAIGPPVGFLGAVQARIAATTLSMLGPEGRELIWDLLTLAGCDESQRPITGADRVIERALILKALAARRHRLGPWSRDGREALFEVSEFAAQIRGASRGLLALATTLRTEQRQKTATCIIGTKDVLARGALVARGDVDPVFAWRTHAAHSDRTSAGAARAPDGSEEALPELDRSPLLDRPRLHQALAEARVRGESLLARRAADALTDYLAGRELNAARLALKDETLARLSKRGFDIVRAASIEAIRQDARGLYRFDAARAFGDLASRFTGAMYLRRVFSDQQTAGNDPLGQIATATQLGLAVPFTVNELKMTFTRPFAILAAKEGQGGTVFEIQDPGKQGRLEVAGKLLVAPVAGAPLGQTARADAYLAPAALDLLAPPFGLPMPEIGIEDRL